MKFKFFLLLFALLSNFKVLSNTVYVDGVQFNSLSDALPSIKDGSTIYLEKGIYSVGAYIKANNISILGETGVVFDNATVDGKAALVLTGKDVLVESIECRNIAVKDGNGACIRFEGENITIRNLYVHDSQSGVKTSRVKGFVRVEHSRFERIGHRNGYSHSMYIIADELHVRFSKILSTKKQGSGIKSRSKKVIVEDSLLASMDGVDSRLIDMANYGELIIKNSILQQGVNSSNSQLIAYGLEKKIVKTYPINRIELKNNLIFFDRQKANVLIKKRLEDDFINHGNIFIGDFNSPEHFLEGNTWFFNRKKAKIKPYPYLPQLNERQSMMEKIKLFGEAKTLSRWQF